MRRYQQTLMCWQIGIGLILCGGCLQTSTHPEVPVSPAATAAREAAVAYARHLADSFDDAGLRLQSGTLTTAEEVNQHLQTANAAARKQAFQPLDGLLNDELGGEKWDAERARHLFQQISTGLRSLP